MKYALLLSYALLLAGVAFLRTGQLGNNLKFEAYEELKNMTNEIATDTVRLLEIAGAQTKDPLRVAICEKSETGEKVSESQIDSGKTQMGEYKRIFGEGVGSYIVNGSMPPTRLMAQKAFIVVIVMIFIVFTPLLSFCYCCYCCCDKKCPVCCKRDYVKNPFSKGEMLCMTISVIFYSVLTFGASISGYVVSNRINSSYLSMKCTIVSMIDDLNLKQQFTLPSGEVVNFIGLNNLLASLNGIIGEIDSYFLGIQTFVTNNNARVSDSEDQSKTILSMLESLKTDQTPQVPNFLVHSAADAPGDPYASTISVSTDSLFLRTSTYTPYVEAMKTAFTAVSTGAVTAMRAALTQATTFSSGSTANTYKAPLIQGVSLVTSAQSSMNSFISSINNTSFVDYVFSLVTVFLMIFYGIFITIAVAGAVISFIGYLKSWYKLRIFLHIFWGILSLLTIAGFVISVFLTIFTVIMMESCDEIPKILNDAAYLRSIKGIPADIIDYATICKQTLGGDGKILNKFNIQSQIDIITQTQNTMANSVSAFSTSSYGAFEDLFSYFKHQHLLFENAGVLFTRGADINFVAVPPTTIGTFPYTLDYAIATASFQQGQSKLSNTTPTYSGITAANNDNVVFQADQCPPRTIDAAFTTPLSGLKCVNLVDGTTTYVAVTSGSVNSRYAASTAGDQGLIFTDFYDKINKYSIFMTAKYGAANQLFTFSTFTAGVGVPSPATNKRSVFIGTIQTAMLRSSPAGFGKKLVDFQVDIQATVINHSTAITQSLIGPTGVLSNINCLFFGAEIDNFINQLCSNSAIAMYQTLKVLLIVCFSNFTLIILLYKMAMRFFGKSQEVQHSHSNPSVIPGHEMQKFV